MITVFEIAGRRFLPDGRVVYQKDAPPLMIDSELGAYYDPHNIPPVKFFVGVELIASVPAYAWDGLAISKRGDEMLISLPPETSFGPGLARLTVA